VIQSAINKEQLRFSEAQQIDQLNSIGLDGKQTLNWLTPTDSSEAATSNVTKRDVESSSGDKIVVHELQIGDIIEDSEVITIPKDTGGRQNLSG
jgi:hypothetical protein